MYEQFVVNHKKSLISAISDVQKFLSKNKYKIELISIQYIYETNLNEYVGIVVYEKVDYNV